MIRLAIAGTGAIAERAHIPAFLEVAGIHLVALQSRTLEKAERVAASDFAVGIGPTRHMDALRMNTSAAQKTKRPPAGGLPVIS